MGEHVGGLDAEATNLRQQPDHPMGATIWLSLQAFKARRLDLPDLLGKQA